MNHVHDVTLATAFGEHSTLRIEHEGSEFLGAAAASGCLGSLGLANDRMAVSDTAGISLGGMWLMAELGKEIK